MAARKKTEDVKTSDTITLAYNRIFGEVAKASLNKLKSVSDIPMKGKVLIARALRTIASEEEIYEKLRLEVVTKYVDKGWERIKEKDKDAPKPPGVQPQEYEQFIKEYQPLMETEITLHLIPIPMSALGTEDNAKTLTADDFLNLDWLIVANKDN